MMNNNQGSKAYLFSIVLVAVLGGLLFGYDTAVISGAEKGLQAFFKGAKDFTYTDGIHGFTCASALIVSVSSKATIKKMQKEQDEKLVAVWNRKDGDLGQSSLDKFIDALCKEIRTKSVELTIRKEE